GLVNTMTRMIGDAILEYEPRVTLDRLEVDDDEAVAGRLLIRIDYTIRATNSRYNMVYPFYLNEATVPGT
ncbi:MAG: GPW/gp25 family protein, partial [bacterium]|nr:GPW/gp25 family protein [bacterium]